MDTLMVAWIFVYIPMGGTLVAINIGHSVLIILVVVRIDF